MWVTVRLEDRQEYVEDTAIPMNTNGQLRKSVGGPAGAIALLRIDDSPRTEVHQEWTQDPVRSGAVWERVDARKG